MRYFVAGAFTLLLSLSALTTANAQLKGEELYESDVTVLTHQSEILEDKYRVPRQNYHNPWTIHKKVARYGLAGSMTATLIGSLAMDDDFFATTVIPVVGPFVTIVRIENDPASYYQPGGKPLLIASGVTQSAFLVYLIVAWIGESSYDARHRSNFSVLPAAGHAGRGLSLHYRF